METPLNERAQKRARLSIIFGLSWLIIPLIALSWIWLSRGPLEPMLPGSLSQAGIAMDRIISVMEKVGLILWILSGLACVFTAFPEPKNPRSWQGKTAVFLAVLVIVISVPLVIIVAFFFIVFS